MNPMRSNYSSVAFGWPHFHLCFSPGAWLPAVPRKRACTDSDDVLERVANLA
jgi:hypothetical protein